MEESINRKSEVGIEVNDSADHIFESRKKSRAHFVRYALWHFSDLFKPRSFLRCKCNCNCDNNSS